jgi:hypothetical protein
VLKDEAQVMARFVLRCRKKVAKKEQGADKDKDDDFEDAEEQSVEHQLVEMGFSQEEAGLGGQHGCSVQDASNWMLEYKAKKKQEAKAKKEQEAKAKKEQEAKAKKDAAEAAEAAAEAQKASGGAMVRIIRIATQPCLPSPLPCLVAHFNYCSYCLHNMRARITI